MCARTDDCGAFIAARMSRIETKISADAQKEKLRYAKVLAQKLFSVQTEHKNLSAEAALLRTNSQVASVLKAKALGLKWHIAEIETNAAML